MVVVQFESGGIAALNRRLMAATPAASDIVGIQLICGPD
jgi:hypothetical protein